MCSLNGVNADGGGLRADCFGYSVNDRCREIEQMNHNAVSAFVDAQ